MQKNWLRCQAETGLGFRLPPNSNGALRVTPPLHEIHPRSFPPAHLAQERFDATNCMSFWTEPKEKRIQKEKKLSKA